MALTLADLFASPDHYLHAFEGGAARFVPMDRAAYHRSIFLDGRIDPAGPGTMAVPAAALASGVTRPAATGWIFHVAHCGSTLLARALDDPAGNLVLREPLALRQTALAPDPARLALVLAMLGKRYRADRPTIVKANVPVNFLLPALVAVDPAMRAIFLYSDADDWLTAILRSDEHRGWLRRVTGQLAGYLGDLAGGTDARRAGALWLAQLRAFAAACQHLPHARSLEAERFFAGPAAVLKAVARHLAVTIDDAAIEARVAGPLFATYSKNPGVAFDNAARMARGMALRARLAPEIAEARGWIEQAGGDDPLVALRAVALA